MSAVESNMSIEDGPKDWPTDVIELRTLDELLRCSICFEYFKIAVSPTGCYHNYCSLCARRSISYKAQCPTCQVEMRESQLMSNRVLDEIVRVFTALRPKLLSILKEYKHLKLRCKGSIRVRSNVRMKGSTSQQSKEGGETVEASIRPETVSTQIGRSGVEDEDCQLKISTKINEVENNFAGSSTSTLSDNELRVVDHINNEKATFSRFSNIDEENRELNKNSSVKQGQKRLQLITQDNNDTGEPVVKRRRLGNEKGSTSWNKPLCDEAVFNDSSDIEDNIVYANEDNDAFSSQYHFAPPKAASNNLLPIREGECRKKLPKIVISGLSDKQLRKKLKEHGLSSKGDKKLLQNRLKSYYLLYNSQCDAINPMPVSDIRKQIEFTEATQKELDKGHVLVQTFDLSKSDKEKQEFNEKYLVEHREQYNSLINDIKERSRRNQAAIGSAFGATGEASEVISQLNDASSALNSDLPGECQTFSSSKDDNQGFCSIDPCDELTAEETFTATNLCRTPQKCSRSREVNTFYQSPEYKAIQILDKAVSKVIPFIEKLHADFCRDNMSPSRCASNASTVKPVEGISEISYHHEDEAKAPYSMQGQLDVDQKPLQSFRRSNLSGMKSARGKSNAHVLQGSQDQSCVEAGPHGGSARQNPILIVDSDEEIDQAIELNQKDLTQNTPFKSAAKGGAEQFGSPIIHSPFLSQNKNEMIGSRILSSTPILSVEKHLSNSPARRADVSKSRNGKSTKDVDDSKRDGTKRNRNRLVSGKKKVKLKSTEASPKINSGGRLKKRQCKSQNIRSYFSKPDENKEKIVSKKSESLRCDVSAGSSALFDTSCSGDSDLEISVKKIDQSPQNRAKVYKSESGEVPCASQSASRNKMPDTSIDSQLADDSDNDFMPKIRRSSKKLKIVSDSSSSLDEFVLRRSIKRDRGITKFVSINNEASPPLHPPVRTGETTDDESANDESTNDESANDESNNGESANDESTNGESANDESTNGESANDESTNDESTRSSELDSPVTSADSKDTFIF